MSQSLLPILLVFAGSVLVATAHAGETVPDFSAADPSCACVAQGKRWAQGDEVCLSGLRMVCTMNQNITSWQSLGQSCQFSSLSRVKMIFTPM
jgi:hypothetical protein